MKYTLAFRIWHWLNAIVVLGLLGTVFLRKTFLSWRTNSEILMTKLSEIGNGILYLGMLLHFWFYIESIFISVTVV